MAGLIAEACWGVGECLHALNDSSMVRFFLLITVISVVILLAMYLHIIAL